jgi:Photosynthetic reaction centre cytochrome C subunit
MNRRNFTCGIACASLVFALGFADLKWLALSAGSAAQQEKTVDQTRNNIQALKGLPESQLFLVMNVVGDSLGVHCDYCHVKNGTDPQTGRDNWLWESDDKQKKTVARRMMKMVLDINKTNFGGAQTVTCYSCHRGETSVAGVVPLPPRNFAEARPDEKKAAQSTAEQILNKYIASVGGESVVAKFKTLVMKGTLERSQGRSDSLEITLKAPDKYLVKLTTGQGVITQVINGSDGWVSSASGSRQLGGDALVQLKRVAALYGVIKFTEKPAQMKVMGMETIGDREAYVIAIEINPNRAKRLFFDTRTGLLLREITMTTTMLAPLPEQVDFEDYRDVDGVNLPFTIRSSNAAAFDTAIRRFTEMRLNAPVDDAIFNRPASPK